MSLSLFVVVISVALIFILIQLFLSLRPSPVWGLVLPCGFLLWLGMTLMDKLPQPESLGIQYNDMARRLYLLVSLGGLVVFLVIYAIGRSITHIREAENRRRYEAYLAAKRAREAKSDHKA